MDHHHFVHKVSRFFPSSLTSCQFRNVPDVVQSSVPIKKGTKVLHQETDPPKPFSDTLRNLSFIKSKAPKSTLKNVKKMDKNYQKKSILLGNSDAEGRRCPPVTPVSVMAPKKKADRAKEITKMMNNSVSSSNSGRWFSSEDDRLAADDQCDGKSDTFFSLSSYTSSESFRLKTAKSNSKKFDSKMSIDLLGHCSSALSAYSVNTADLSPCSRKTTKTGRERTKKLGRSTKRDMGCDDFVIDTEILKGRQVFEPSAELYYDGFGSRKTAKSHRKTGKNHHRRSKKGQMRSDKKVDKFLNIVVEGGVEDSYAVEKSTSDPYNDFRTSMVEMIIEKQIFGAKDLEKLLDCFLSLNSPYYHRVILEVFTEICDTLFAY